MKKKISIVTTCRNEIGNVNEWIADIEQQTVHADEIVIVDGMSNDGTFEILQQWKEKDSRVKLVSMKSLPAAGRNKAIEIAENEIIASTDMGCRLDKNWLHELTVPMLNDESVEIVVGNFSVDSLKIRTLVGWADYIANGGYKMDPTAETYLPTNRSVAFKKHVWEKLGKYPEDLTFAGDDAVFGLIARYRKTKFAYAHRAMCFWERHVGLKGFWKENRTYGFANGEAEIMKTKLMNIKNDIVYFTAIIFYAIFKTVQAFIRSDFRLVKFSNFFAIAIIIPLAYSCTFNYYYGYRAGYKKGSVSALLTRKRLIEAKQC